MADAGGVASAGDRRREPQAPAIMSTEESFRASKNSRPHIDRNRPAIAHWHEPVVAGAPGYLYRGVAPRGLTPFALGTRSARRLIGGCRVRVVLDPKGEGARSAALQGVGRDNDVCAGFEEWLDQGAEFRSDMNAASKAFLARRREPLGQMDADPPAILAFSCAGRVSSHALF